MRNRSNPTRVGELLETALPRLREPLATSRLQRHWRVLVGQEIARRAQPTTLTDGILQVAVDNSPWLQELSLREAEVLHRIQSAVGPGLIRGLRFVLQAREDGYATPREGRRSSRRAPLTPVERASVKEMVSDLDDATLATTLERLLTKAALAKRHPGVNS
ncbi:MAG TPA: DUF721 domain-containing protein [Methylomirabilota bacterium]|nr:DUF721 domain-containing protein [Methylomirabilota bacterium]